MTHGPMGVQCPAPNSIHSHLVLSLEPVPEMLGCAREQLRWEVHVHTMVRNYPGISDSECQCTDPRGIGQTGAPGQNDPQLLRGQAGPLGIRDVSKNCEARPCIFHVLGRLPLFLRDRVSTRFHRSHTNHRHPQTAWGQQRMQWLFKAES